MIISEQISPLSYTTGGREAVFQRMQFLHGPDITVIKSKAVAYRTADQMCGYVLNQDQLQTFLGDTLYPDWGGEPNALHDSAQLVHVEANRASCYLVFIPVQ